MCGAAPNLFEDLEAARDLRPAADILGVNYVGSLVDEIEEVWTQHAGIAEDISSDAGRALDVHSRVNWPSLAWTGGSSGFAGALWARQGLGYDEIIMAGSPVSGDIKAYHQDYAKIQGKLSAIFSWQRQILGFKERGLTAGIYSMSGWTKTALGEVPLVGATGRAGSIASGPLANRPAAL